MNLMGLQSQQTSGIPANAFITGVEGISEVGELIATGGASIELYGVGAIGRVGTLVPTEDVFAYITGVEGTGQVGELISGGDATATITGVEGIGQVSSPVRSFVQVGNALVTDIEGNSCDIIALDENTIVLSSSTASRSLRVFSWDGTDWSPVGNSFNSSDTSSALAKLTSTTFAGISVSTNRLKAYSWDGTDITQIGSELTTNLGGGGKAGLCGMSSTRVCGGNITQLLRAWDWNGSTWTLRTGSFSPSSSTFDVTALDSSTVAVSINSSPNRTLRTLSYSGSAWTLVGSVFTHPSNTMNGNPTSGTFTSSQIAVSAQSMRGFTWNGSTWALMTAPFDNNSQAATIAVLNSTDIVRFFQSTGTLTRMRLT